MSNVCKYEMTMINNLKKYCTTLSLLFLYFFLFSNFQLKSGMIHVNTYE